MYEHIVKYHNTYNTIYIECIRKAYELINFTEGQASGRKGMCQKRASVMSHNQNLLYLILLLSS